MKPPDKPPIEVGSVFEVPYPFVRDTFSEHYADEDGQGVSERQTWRPGTRFVERGHARYPDDAPPVDCVADAIGAQLIWVISVHKPGSFPTRVFYTRQWRDPDGKAFGKGGLRSKTLSAFRSLVRGYRHPFKVEPPA